MKRITTPLTEDIRRKLKAGQEVLLSGTVYTARDAAHKKLTDLYAKKRRLPFDIKDACVYYAGPTPDFGSCGPTTSSRMDEFTLSLLVSGLGGMIGKGRRSKNITAAIKKYRSVYFLAVGGAGAYLAGRIQSHKVVAFKELGPEAIYKLQVKDFPLIVGIDSLGNDIYRVKGQRGKEE
jgi:fumarate hydratase subunit beta